MTFFIYTVAGLLIWLVASLLYLLVVTWKPDVYTLSKPAWYSTFLVLPLYAIELLFAKFRKE